MTGTISWASSPGLFKKASWEEVGVSGRVSNSVPPWFLPQLPSMMDWVGKHNSDRPHFLQVALVGVLYRSTRKGKWTLFIRYLDGCDGFWLACLWVPAHR